MLISRAANTHIGVATPHSVLVSGCATGQTGKASGSAQSRFRRPPGRLGGDLPQQVGGGEAVHPQSRICPCLTGGVVDHHEHRAAPATETQPTSSATTATVAAPTGPASFVVAGTTEQGDKVKLEGRFGSPAPVSGSEVQSTAVEGCPAPANDGRAIIVRLDLAAALESSLSGEVVARFTGGNGANKPFFLLGTTQGAACESQSEAKVDFGTLQPGQSGNMAIWLVLANAISPDNPQPTEETLANEGWEIQAPELLVNEATVYGAPGQPTRATGPRVPACSEGLQYVAIFAGTPDASICE
jgi:hypothetical protein